MSEETEYMHRLLLELIERKIAIRAYELYQARRDARGSALEDWLQAEDEVLGQSISAPLYHRRKAVGHSVC
jgi:hypothetical protein